MVCVVAGFVGRLNGWRRALAAFSVGAASILAMAPFFLWPILCLTLPTLVWLIDSTAHAVPEARPSRKTRRGRPLWRAAAAGWWFGFGYFLFGLFWVGEAFLVEAETFAWLLPFAVTLLPAGLALFFAMAAAAARLAWSPGWERVLVLAVALGASEWLRGHILTGFPWNTLGYALTAPTTLMQSASLIGVDALTPIVVIVGAAPLVTAAETTATGRARWRGALLSAVLLSVLAGYGVLRLARETVPTVADVRLRIVQPSIDQRQKWQPEYQRANFDRHLDLSRTNSAGRVDDLTGITHLIWPEAAMPFLPLERPEALAEVGALLPRGVQLLSGGLRLAPPETVRTNDAASSAPPTARATNGARRAFNSLMVFGFGGGLAALYDKIHLVPFGEYLPFQSTLEAIGLEQLTRVRGGFASGPAPRPLLAVAGLPPLGVLICYEAIFPDEVIQGKDRPGLFLNITNDGWFGRTTGPHQHFHQSRVRAVEQGIPLIRAANNGISAMIDPYGRVLARLDLDERGVIDTELPEAIAPPPFAHLGMVGLALVLAVCGGTAAVARRRRHSVA